MKAMSDYVIDLAHGLLMQLERVASDPADFRAAPALDAIRSGLERGMTRAHRRGDRDLKEFFGLHLSALTCTPQVDLRPEHIAVIAAHMRMLTDGGPVDRDDLRIARDRLTAAGLQLILPR